MINALVHLHMDASPILIGSSQSITIAMLLLLLNRYIIPIKMQYISNILMGKIDNVNLISLVELLTLLS